MIDMMLRSNGARDAPSRCLLKDLARAVNLPSASKYGMLTRKRGERFADDLRSHQFYVLKFDDAFDDDLRFRGAIQQSCENLSTV